MRAALRVLGLDHHYGSAQGLRGASFDIVPASALTLLGRNGAGETTLLRCLVGVLRPSSGSILPDGEEIGGWPALAEAMAASAMCRGDARFLP